MVDNGPVNERGPGRPRGTSHAQIRDIALGLFLEQGYAGTSLASIARTAGVSRTTLFAYFRTKRDIIWVDHDERTSDLEQILDAGPARPVIDLIMRGLLATAHYEIDDHATLASRLRVVEQDEELRAYSALMAQDASERVIDGVIRRVPDADPEVVGVVAWALSGAASRCVREWAAQDEPTVSLEVHVSRAVAPVVEALRPLLP